MTEEKREDENFISEKESKLAKDVLKIIAQSDIRLGARENIPGESTLYKDTAKRILALYLKADICKGDMEVLRSLMVQATSIAHNITLATVEFAENMALEKLWGKHPDEVTLNDIDKMMEVPERLKKENKDK